MRALVVGGSGYLGSAVARAFAERDIEVVSLSRSGTAYVGEGVRGDVRYDDLAMEPERARELRATVTHVVSCFGSVDWDAGPRTATELHLQGTRAVMRYAASCPRLQRMVHVSSVLVLGRARGAITDELELGQSFRNWYEYGKYLAERAVRMNDALPSRIVRLGAVIGPGRDVPPDTAHGILAIVPFLLRGYPIHLADRGSFPCYACDAVTAGEVLARAALNDGGELWTWFDQELPSVARVLVALCSAWAVVPRIASLPLLVSLARLTAERLGLPRALLEYAEPLAEIPAEILTRLPRDLPLCPAGYLRATSESLRRSSISPGVA
jgi:nucleoside-diphosphate-sugar epimerase